MNEVEKNILFDLGIMDKCGDLSHSNFAKITCFCHIYTDKDFANFTALKEKGLIDYKETSKGIKNVRLTKQGQCVLKDFNNPPLLVIQKMSKA